MSGINLAMILHIVLASGYLLLANLATQRELGYGRIQRLIIWYSIIAASWELGLFFTRPGVFFNISAHFFAIERVLGLSLLAIALLACTIEFLIAGIRHYLWVWLGLAWVAIVALLPIFKLQMSEEQQILAAVFGWLLMYINALAISLHAWRSPDPSLLKRQTRLWILGLLIIFIGDITALLSLESVGNFVRLVGFGLLFSQVFIYSRQDFNWAVQRGYTFIVQSLVVAAICISVLLLDFSHFSIGDLTRGQVDALVKAVFLALIAVPVLTILFRTSSRQLVGMGFDMAGRVQAYYQEINRIVELEQLTNAALAKISDMFALEYAGLFLVDANDQSRVYTIELFEATENVPPTPEGIKMAYHSPVARGITETHHPITPGELLNLPDIPTISHIERTWVIEQPFQLYVPIKSAQRWLGMFALGKKRSGEQFYEQDLELLNQLAAQTAAVLANARLLDSTLRLNVELQQAQNEILENNRKLRELDENKTAFIGVLTHELRTPIANIQFSLQVLEMYFKNQMNSEQRRQFDEVNGNVKKARSMIDNLVSFAAFLNDKVQLIKEELDFRNILREALLPYKEAVDTKGLKVRVNMTGDNFKLIGDRQLLKEAVSQLISNAVKFSAKGEIWITCWTTAEALILDIQDSGIGIPADRLEQVWNAFTQLTADSLKRGVEGLGLGLGLVKYIITAHGGQVWVESKVGEGSIFGFKLPLAGPSHPLPPGRVSRPARIKVS